MEQFRLKNEGFILTFHCSCRCSCGCRKALPGKLEFSRFPLKHNLWQKNGIKRNRWMGSWWGAFREQDEEKSWVFYCSCLYLLSDNELNEWLAALGLWMGLLVLAPSVWGVNSCWEGGEIPSRGKGSHQELPLCAVSVNSGRFLRSKGGFFFSRGVGSQSSKLLIVSCKGLLNLLLGSIFIASLGFSPVVDRSCSGSEHGSCTDSCTVQDLVVKGQGVMGLN